MVASAGVTSMTTLANLRLPGFFLATLLFVTGVAAVPPVDLDLFKGSGREFLLCFDLREAEHPVRTGVLLNPKTTTSTNWQHIALPFLTKSCEPVHELFLTWGSYEKCTVLSALMLPGAGSERGFGLLPDVQLVPEGGFVVDDLLPGVYLQKSRQERYFVFVNWNDSAPGRGRPISLGSLALKEFDALAIATPPGAKGREIRNNSSAIPRPLLQTGRVRVFAGTNYPPHLERVELAYTVAPTELQKLIFKNGLKLLGVLLAPLLTLLFLPAKGMARPKWRMPLVVVLALVQLTVIVWVAITATQLGSDSVIEQTIDWAVVVIGTVFSAFVVFAKEKN